MSNPLLESFTLPPFSQIEVEHIEPAIDTILADNRRLLAELLASIKDPTWENLLQPIDEFENRLNRVWSPISHMNSVKNSKPWSEAYSNCLQKISAYATEVAQNEQLYKAIKKIADSEQYQQLSIAQRKIINNALRDFRLAGVNLPTDQKQKFQQIQQKLAVLTNQFEQNVLDATHGWYYLITDEADLVGIPEHAITLAKQAAETKSLQGWCFTLDFPSYQAIITYADKREIRESMYRAFVTRASEQGPNAGKWDNTNNMNEILALRHELAQIVGFNNYAEYSLATKMADKPEQVITFLHDLARRSKAQAQRDYKLLCKFVRETYHQEELQAWDIAYYSEKLRQQQYAISQEDLRPYFPEHQVLEGMFTIIKRLYGMTVHECFDVDVWHKDVKFFNIFDAQNNLRGQVYMDLYARPGKRGGAWMDECVQRMRFGDGHVQTPVAYVNCNFSGPTAEKPALFTHEEVLTIFHEMGHALHHILTQIDYSGVSGINGVAWDAVELPSQFFENWCWELPALKLIAQHYETHVQLPNDLYQRMLAARNFQSALQMLRQMEFSLFDFKIHWQYHPNISVQTILNEVRREIAVIPVPEFNRFQHSFTHVFSGGYAAGYYSYKWAEVLSSDAFSKFEENGIFDKQTGAEFLHYILEQGGSKEPMELFMEFRGREPKIDALLRHNGIMA
ncbi:MAG: oligopeptidase A [Gammaproteobacteria bacterium]